MVTPFNSSYTFPQHRISITDNLRAGNAISAAGQLNGVPVSVKQFERLGNPAVGYTNTDGVLSVNIILSGTAFSGAGSVAPNTAPTNGSLVSGVATLDFPRTLDVSSSNSGDTTQTVTITGTDYYGAPMTQAYTLDGETAVLGLKAFYTVNTIAVSAAMTGDLYVGVGSALGLSYALLTGSLPVGSKNVSGTISADAGTVVQADPTSPATSSTGDVRGTYKPAGTLAAATTYFYVEYQTLDGPLNTDAYGQPQA